MMLKPVFNIFWITWLTAYSGLVWANSTLTQDIIAYDWLSLMFAMIAGILGGVARTILTLASSNNLVFNIKQTLLKDMVVALIGGGAAYLAIQGYNEWISNWTSFVLPKITRDFRILIIVAAGFSRGGWLTTADKFVADAIANTRHKLRGDANPDNLLLDAPASVPLAGDMK